MAKDCSKKHCALKALAVLAAILAILAIVVAMQPSEFKITRSATFNAPPAKLFAQVNNLKKWNAWSPWAKLDPNAKNSFEGPAAGKGAVMSWDGNRDVGAGSMKITESRPNNLVKFQLDFLKPMKGTSTAEFTFKGDAKQTTVTWSMEGHKNFVAKAMGLVFNCDKMVGEQFEQGLANLKTVVEGKAAPKP